MVALFSVKGKNMKEKTAFLRSVGAIMIVVKVDHRTGFISDSTPCIKCYNKLKNLGITIYFSRVETTKRNAKKHLTIDF